MPVSETKVTAIVPAYNAEPFIERAVASALDQTHSNTDVIVVNDGSNDATLEICQRMSARHARLTVVSRPNGGVAAARNDGIERARSPWVAFLDADDVWHPTKISKQLAALQRHDSAPAWAASYVYYRRINADDRVIGDGELETARGDLFCEHLLHNHVGNGSSILVRREVAQEVGGFDPSYAAAGMQGIEDYDFQLKIARLYKVELVPEFLVGYRHHAACMSLDHASMGRGLMSVVEKHCADESRHCENEERAIYLARADALIRFAKSRNWAMVLATLHQINQSSEDRSAIAELYGLARRALRALAPSRPQLRLGGQNPAPALARTFLDYDPALVWRPSTLPA